MSIWAKQEICLHLKELRCLAVPPSGNYALRFHVFYKIQHRHYFAVPVSIMQGNSSQNCVGNELGETSYTTRPFIMKPDLKVHLPS